MSEEEKKELAPADMFQQDAGIGQEDIGREDLTVPRISILQALSPQVQKQKAEFIEGAEVGQICNSVSSQIYDGDDGAIVVPISYRRTYLEWKPRQAGGGLVADHGNNPEIIKGCTKDERNRDVTDEGNTISLTAEYFLFVVDIENKTWEPVALSMSSSQIRAARKWNTMMSSFKLKGENGPYTPPFFSRAYRLTTVPQSNEQGDWFGWSVEPVDLITKVLGDDVGMLLYNEAKKFREQIAEGSVKAAGEEITETEGDDSPM